MPPVTPIRSRTRRQRVVAHEQHAHVARKADQEYDAHDELRHGGVHEGLAAKLQELTGVLLVPFPVGQCQEYQQEPSHRHGRHEEVQKARDQRWLGEVEVPARGVGEVLPGPARGSLAEGEIVAEQEANQEDQDHAEQHHAAGSAAGPPAPERNVIETVVSGREEDQHQEPGPGHHDGRGVEELPVENLHEQQRSDAQGDGGRQQNGQLFGHVKKHAVAALAIPGAPLRHQRKDASAEHEIHGDNVEEERHDQQQFEDPIGRGQRVRVQGRNHVGRRHLQFPPCAALPDPFTPRCVLIHCASATRCRLRELQVRHERKQAGQILQGFAGGIWILRQIFEERFAGASPDGTWSSSGRKPSCRRWPQPPPRLETGWTVLKYAASAPRSASVPANGGITPLCMNSRPPSMA